MIRPILIVLIAILAASPSAATAETLTEEWIAAWRSDLEELERKLPEVHADPYHQRSREQLEADFASLEARLPELETHEAVVSLAEIIASIGDGHTRLTWPLAEGIDFMQGHSSTSAPESPAIRIHAFPIRLGIYEEGVFVERIDVRHRELAGARLVAIDGMEIEKIMERLEPVIRRDNELQTLELMPETLVLAEVLHARGVIEEPTRARWTFVRPSGDLVIVPLGSLADGEKIEWSNAFGEIEERPISHRYLAAGFAPRRGVFSRRFWFDWLAEHRAVYLQFNEVYNEDDESLFDFSRRLQRFIADHPVDKLIVDLRFNWGGNNSLARPLLHAIIASEKARRPGSIFVIIGRGTFSAAMTFAVDLERHLSPIFVGEPTGSSPNHYGDSRKLRLPKTGLTVRASTLYWQYAGPRDDRSAIRPLIDAPPRWSDLMDGRDAALEAILEAPRRSSLDEAWQGTLALAGREIQVRVDSLFPTDESHGSMTSDSWEFFPPDTAFQIEMLSGESPVRFSATDESGLQLLFEGVFVGHRLVGHLVQSKAKGNPFAFSLQPVGGAVFSE